MRIRLEGRFVVHYLGNEILNRHQFLKVSRPIGIEVDKRVLEIGKGSRGNLEAEMVFADDVLDEVAIPSEVTETNLLGNLDKIALLGNANGSQGVRVHRGVAFQEAIEGFVGVGSGDPLRVVLELLRVPLVDEVLNTGGEVLRYFDAEGVEVVDREKIGEHIEHPLASLPFGEGEDDMDVRQVLLVVFDEGVIFEVVNFGKKIGEACIQVRPLLR